MTIILLHDGMLRHDMGGGWDTTLSFEVVLAI